MRRTSILPVEDGEMANFTRVLSVCAPERCTLPDDTFASEYGMSIDVIAAASSTFIIIRL